MWLKAKSPVRYASDKPAAKVGDKFEVADADAAELLACGAAEETQAPPAAVPAAETAAAAEAATAEAATPGNAAKAGKKAA